MDRAAVHLTAADKAHFEKTNARGPRDGVVVDAALSDPKTFNLLIAKEVNSTAPLGLIFDTLVTRDLQTLRMVPALAESYQSSPDGRQWTFNLRRGVRWSDGQPLTADDVIFTFNLIYDKKVETTTRELLLVDKKPWAYRKLDDYTIRIDLPATLGPFLDTISGVPIMPKHKLERPWKEGKFNSTWGINTDPREIVGTGPFVLARYLPGERLVFRRNPYYWKLAADGETLPMLKGAVTQIVPDLNALVLKFRARESDYVGLRPQDWRPLHADQKMGRYHTYDLGPDWVMTFLSFNQNPNAKDLPAYKREWFAKKEFRQAVSYALDRASMIRAVYRGMAKPMWSPISEANKVFYNPRVRQYPHDPARARALLASIGFQDRNGDGVLEDQAGHSIEFTLLTNSNNNMRVTLGNMIQDDLQKVGIKVDFTPIEFNSFVTRLDSSYSWEALLIGFTAGIDPHGSTSMWTSPGMHHLWYPKEKSPATPWEAEIDKIFSEAAQTADQARRKALYDRFQEIAAEEQPLIELVTPDSLIAVRDRLGNTSLNSLAARWNLWEWTAQ